MTSLGLREYLKKCGSVTLHEQGKLGQKTYEELKGIQSTLQNYLKHDRDGHLYAIDIKDANMEGLDNKVFVQITYMPMDIVKKAYFLGKEGNESYFKMYDDEEIMARKIYEFASKVVGNRDDKAIDRFVRNSRQRYNKYITSEKNNTTPSKQNQKPHVMQRIFEHLRNTAALF